MQTNNSAASCEAVEGLAQTLHEAGREAVEKNLLVRSDVPVRAFVEWDDLPDAAREGRRIQARFLLDRFDLIPRENEPKNHEWYSPPKEQFENPVAIAQELGIDYSVPSAWPLAPTCHNGDVFARRFAPHSWTRDGGVSLRCSYCGSLHPAELLDALQNGATLELADEKYGWPHKFYVHAPVGRFKWGNAHLQDKGFAPEAWKRLVDSIEQQTDIGFILQDGELKWRRLPKG